MDLSNFKEYDEKYSHSVGLYAFYFKNTDCIAQFEAEAAGLIEDNIKNKDTKVAYIGKTLHGFKARDLKAHFDGEIKRSTLRKTISALLEIKREEYMAGKTSKQRCVNPGDENKISEFLNKNFEFKILPITDKNSIEAIEEELIIKYQPPFNIDYRDNDDLKKKLKALRKIK